MHSFWIKQIISSQWLLDTEGGRCDPSISEVIFKFKFNVECKIKLNVSGNFAVTKVSSPLHVPMKIFIWNAVVIFKETLVALQIPGLVYLIVYNHKK